MKADCTLQKLRLKEIPTLPRILEKLNKLTIKALSDLSVSDEIKSFFPNLTQKTVSFVEGEKGMHQKKRVGVLFSGGQAAGGHNVIIGLFDALKKLHPDSELFGFLGGPSGLIKNQFIQLDKGLLSNYLNQGGFDLLGSGRTKISKEEQFVAVGKNVKELKLDGLVIIGGDDSNTNAAFLAEYFSLKKINTAVIGIPKTIDGDLKTDSIEISFGFDTASKTYSDIIGNIARDAISAKKYYYFVKLMGRTASHITLECAAQVHPNMAIISEEVKQEKKTLRSLIEEICELIRSRASLGLDYGLILIPEGLLEFIHDLSYSSLPTHLQTQFLEFRDPHGNLEVSKIDTERFLIELVKIEIDKQKIEGSFKGTFSPQPIFCGYEGRSCFPSLFDAKYTYALGHVASLLIHENLTGYMALVKDLTKNVENWQIGAVPLLSLMHMEMRQGQLRPVIKKAMVDLNGSLFQKFKEKRNEWKLKDDYQFKGPIQFYGPAELTDNLTLTLLEDKK